MISNQQPELPAQHLRKEHSSSSTSHWISERILGSVLGMLSDDLRDCFNHLEGRQKARKTTKALFIVAIDRLLSEKCPNIGIWLCLSWFQYLFEQTESVASTQSLTQSTYLSYEEMTSETLVKVFGANLNGVTYSLDRNPRAKLIQYLRGNLSPISKLIEGVLVWM